MSLFRGTWTFFGGLNARHYVGATDNHCGLTAHLALFSCCKKRKKKNVCFIRRHDQIRNKSLVPHTLKINKQHKYSLQRSQMSDRSESGRRTPHRGACKHKCKCSVADRCPCAHAPCHHQLVHLRIKYYAMYEHEVNKSLKQQVFPCSCHFTIMLYFLYFIKFYKGRITCILCSKMGYKLKKTTTHLLIGIVPNI